MSEAPFSPHWYRVKSLRPELRSHTNIHRHSYRGKIWYLIQDKVSGRHHRFTIGAYQLIALMDGEMTVQQLWDKVIDELGDDAPTQGEVINLVSQLYTSDLIKCDIAPNTRELFDRINQRKRSQNLSRWRNPLAIRIPLFDPDRVLNALFPVLRLLVNPVAGFIWLAVIIAALALTTVQWQELTAVSWEETLNPANLILLLCLYPVVKLLHELGHAITAKLEGGEVHEIGIMLLVFMPIPYVDASCSTTFCNKYRRMLVGAAGIMVELFLASLALFLWLAIEPGLVRSIAFNVMLIGGFSTLFFNGNPLLRYDGYYVLADWLGIPNLATRANRYIGYLFQKYVFGVRELSSPAHSDGEARWFVCYGTLAFCYRIFITLLIALFVAQKFFVVGVLLASWAIVNQMLLPVIKAVKRLGESSHIQKRRLRVLSSSLALGLAVFVLVGIVPVPMTTNAQGVVWPSDDTQVRAGGAGFVKEILVEPNTLVRKGDVLVRIEDIELEAHAEILAARVDAIRARYVDARSRDRVEARIIKDELDLVEADLAHAQLRVKELTVTSAVDGQFVLPDEQDLEGQYVAQGTLLGYVFTDENVSAKVVVPQSRVGLVRERAEGLEVRIASDPGEVMAAELLSEVPQAITRLPSKVLAAEGGGPFAVDPADQEGLLALDSVFEFEVSLPLQARESYVGTRVYAHFDHGHEPLVTQWYRSLRQLFLRSFNV